MPLFDDDAMIPEEGEDATTAGEAGKAGDADAATSAATDTADAPEPGSEDEPEVKGEQIADFRLTIDDPEADEDDADDDGNMPQVEVASVRLFQVNACKRRIEVEYDADHATSEFERQFRELNRTIQIDGFRRGKIPRSILEKRFGKEVRDEVQQNLVQYAVDRSMKHFELDVVGQPSMKDPEDAKVGESFAFSFSLEVRPQFELGDYRKLPVKKPAVEVSDHDVDHELFHMREHKSVWEPVEDGAKLKDMMVVSYRLPAEGDEVIAEKDDVTVVVAPDKLENVDLVGGKDLQGLKAGDEVTLKARLPAGIAEEGEPDEVDVRVKVSEVKRQAMPEADDQFAQDAGFENLAALKADVKDDLQKQKEDKRDKLMHAQLVDALIAAHPFDLPEDLVTQEARHLDARRKMDLYRMGVPIHMLEQLGGDMDQTRGEVGREMRKTFILDAIGKKERIFATEDDYDLYVQELAERYQASEEEMRSHLESQGMDDTARSELREKKILDFILSKAAVEEVGADQFEEIAKAHGMEDHHHHHHDHDDDHEHDEAGGHSHDHGHDHDHSHDHGEHDHAHGDKPAHVADPKHEHGHRHDPGDHDHGPRNKNHKKSKKKGD